MLLSMQASWLISDLNIFMTIPNLFATMFLSRESCVSSVRTIHCIAPYKRV